ncbi:phosphate transporter family protein [Dictyocaulus viviparus]|uniref:Phosphate transporter family protein n=1 Tax=Dictyocaulus viviparus TaxID=29172 RepID=A0A0D8XSK8_DICVI|nr:phosphate transporter family protein [Dictyocaulus viviparus]
MIEFDQYHGEVHKMACLVISWFVSPLTSGIISSVFYIFVDYAILRKDNPFMWGMKLLPLFYFLCVTYNIFMVTWKGSKLLHFDRIPLWGSFLLAVGNGAIAVVAVQYILKPHIQKKIEGSNSIFNLIYSNSTRNDNSRALQLFAAVQILTACFAGFAHGAQDTGNAVAPVAALLSIYWSNSTQQNEEVPIYVLLYGVLGICVGLIIFGDRVITTIGKKVSDIDAASGFTIEFGAAITSLLASKLGLPISTTHCVVGSVVMVGYLRSSKRMKWSLLRNIAISWLVTIPISAIISAASMLLLISAV